MVYFYLEVHAYVLIQKMLKTLVNIVYFVYWSSLFCDKNEKLC